MEHETSFLSAILGLMFVLGLIFLLSYLIKRFGSPLLCGTAVNPKKNHIELIELRQIDPKNRVVLFRCKNKEYLIATGENNVLIDSFNIIPDNNKIEKCGEK